MNQELFQATVIKKIIVSKDKWFEEKINQAFFEKRGTVVTDTQAYYTFLFTCLADNIDTKEGRYGSVELSKYGEKQIRWFYNLVGLGPKDDIQDTFHTALLRLAKYDIFDINEVITKIADEQDSDYHTKAFLAQHVLEFSENDALTEKAVNYAHPSTFSLLGFALEFDRLNQQITKLIAAHNRNVAAGVVKEILDDAMGNDEIDYEQERNALIKKRDSIVSLIEKLVVYKPIRDLKITNGFVTTFFESQRYDSNWENGQRMQEIAMSILASQTPPKGVDRSKLITQLPLNYATYYLPSLTDVELERVPQYYLQKRA